MRKTVLVFMSLLLVFSSSTIPAFAATRKHKPRTPTPTPVVTPLPQGCTNGWYITGYFTPIESDYTGVMQTVHVGKTSYSFNAAFLTTIKTEGWGKTHLGNYIGFYDNVWHFANAPLDANDTPLSSNTVAVDSKIIPLASKLTIPSIASLATKTFRADDIGNGVVGKHIDVYTGEGKSAEQLTFKITGNNNTVCVK